MITYGVYKYGVAVWRNFPGYTEQVAAFDGCLPLSTRSRHVLDNMDEGGPDGYAV